jgi:hypothetical protein
MAKKPAAIALSAVKSEGVREKGRGGGREKEMEMENEIEREGRRKREGFRVHGHARAHTHTHTHTHTHNTHIVRVCIGGYVRDADLLERGSARGGNGCSP